MQNIFNEKNKLPVSANNYIQEMHMIFNSIKINGREIWEIEHCDVQKKIELAFKIGLPVNETPFSKTTITKNNTFFT